MSLLFKKLNSNAKLPVRMTLKSAGLDVFSLGDVIIYAYQTVFIDTGIAVKFPDGFYGAVEGRSSLALQQIFCCSGTSKNSILLLLLLLLLYNIIFISLEK